MHLSPNGLAGQDYVEDGEMPLDYRLREGVVRKGNALESMRLIGIKV